SWPAEVLWRFVFDRSGVSASRDATQDATRFGMIRMISASSESIPEAYCGYFFLSSRITLARALAGAPDITLAVPRTRTHHRRVHSSEYSSINTATCGLARICRTLAR